MISRARMLEQECHSRFLREGMGQSCEGEGCMETVGQFAAAMRNARRVAGSTDLGKLCARCLDAKRLAMAA